MFSTKVFSFLSYFLIDIKDDLNLFWSVEDTAAEMSDVVHVPF